MTTAAPIVPPTPVVQCDIDGRPLVAAGATTIPVSGTITVSGTVAALSDDTVASDITVPWIGSVLLAKDQGAATLSRITAIGSPLADARSNSQRALVVGAFGFGFNGATWDMIRAGAFTASATVTGRLQALPLGVYNSSAPALTNGQYSHIQLDINGNQQENLATLISGEDQTNNRLWGGPKFSYLAAVTADAQVKAGAGVLHTVTLSSDAAATAGTLIIYDSLTETGTIIETITFIAAYLAPVTLIFDCAFATGCYLGLTTTGDVSISATYL